MACFHVKPVKCKLQHVQRAYAGKDNPVEFQLTTNHEAFDASTASAIRVKFGEVIVDSSVDSADFDLSKAKEGIIAVSIASHPVEPRGYNMGVEVVTAKDKLLYFGHMRVAVVEAGM